MRPLWIPGVCLAVAATAFGQAAPPQQVEFNFKYTPGKVSRIRMVSKNVGSTKLPDPLPEVKMAQTVEQVMENKCLKVNPDGSGEFEMTFTDVAMKMNMGMYSMEFDSRKPAPQTQPDFINRMMQRVFNSMVGMKVKLTSKPTGEVVKIEGLSEAMKKMLESVSAESSEAEKQSLKQFGDLFSDQTLDDALKSCSRMLPGKKGPYRVGDKWEHEWSKRFPVIGTMTTKGQYEVVAIETFRNHPCVKIRTRETFTTEGNTPEAPQMDMMGAFFKSFDVKVSSTAGEGYAYIDYQTGEVVQARSTSDLTVTMNMETKTDGANAPEAINMAQKMKTLMTMDLEEPAAGAQPPKPAAAAQP